MSKNKISYKITVSKAAEKFNLQVPADITVDDSIAICWIFICLLLGMKKDKPEYNKVYPVSDDIFHLFPDLDFDLEKVCSYLFQIFIDYKYKCPEDKRRYNYISGCALVHGFDTDYKSQTYNLHTTFGEWFNEWLDGGMTIREMLEHISKTPLTFPE